MLTTDANSVQKVSSPDEARHDPLIELGKPFRVHRHYPVGYVQHPLRDADNKRGNNDRFGLPIMQGQRRLVQVVESRALVSMRGCYGLVLGA